MTSNSQIRSPRITRGRLFFQNLFPLKRKTFKNEDIIFYYQSLTNEDVIFYNFFLQNLT